MKRSTLIAITLMAILFIGLQQKGWSQATLPHYDGIDYTAGGSLQTQTGWTTLNSGDNLLIASGNLSYAGIAAPVGNKVTFDGSGIDAAKLFTQQLTGTTVYYSFFLNVSSLGSLGTAGGYFTGFTEGTTTSFGGTVWARKDVNGTSYDLAINPRTTASNCVWSATPYSTATTVFVVISYQLNSGATNDVVKMWVNPDASSFGGTEPTATVSATNTGVDLANVNRILIRQDGSTATPFIEMDELRIGTSWAEVTPTGSTSVVASPVFDVTAGNYFTQQNVSITCATPGATIRYTTDGTTPNNTTSPIFTGTPIPITTTTTLKSIAYLSGWTESSMTAALYRFPIDVSNIAALRAGVSDGLTMYRLTGDALVTYSRGVTASNQQYLQDATAAIVTYDQYFQMPEYAIGDKITSITGKLQLYNSLLEFVPVANSANPPVLVSSGNTITPFTGLSISSLGFNDQSKLISIPNITFTSATGNFAAATSYNVTQAPAVPPTVSGIFRTIFAEADYIVNATPIPTTPQSMLALVDQYGTAVEIVARSMDDITPFVPSWTAGWPKAENITQASFNAKVNLDVPGTAYYVVLPNGATAPSALQVKNGQNASGTPVALSGSIACAAASTEYVGAVTGLTYPTTYNVYFVAEAYGTLQAAPVMVSFSTTADPTAPVVNFPTATSITDVSAILGGTISSNGGSPITARGTVWSTVTGVTISDHPQVAAGTGTGAFTDTRTGLPTGVQIFYKAYATNGIGTTLSSESSFYTLATEPTNHATAFSAGTTTTVSIPLSWTDATGAVIPTGYLIKGSAVGYADIVDPVDGVAEANLGLVQNVAASVGNCTISGLLRNTPYYFKIYPYTGSASSINYKTSVTVPTATATTQSGTYTWVGADGGSWAVSTNWSPARTAPSAIDILQFNDNTTKTIIGVPTETIGKLIMSGTTVINLQSSVAVTLTIAGDAGTDLVVPAGCELNLTGAATSPTAIAISLLAGATASIDGKIAFSSTAATAHRLTAATAGAVVFHNGSSFTAGANFTGNPFGAALPYLAVVFESGSTYIAMAGSNPFGFSQPNSVVQFQAGSLYKAVGTATAAIQPAFSGRTYADVEIDQLLATTCTGGAGVTMDNLTITRGTLNMGMTGPTSLIHQIKGNITVATGATLNLNPGSAGVLNLNGTTAQTISGGGTITGNSAQTIVINNNAGVTLNADATLNGSITLTSGLLTLGTGNLTFGATGGLTGTPSATNMIVATGAGQLRKIFAAAGNYTFPVGDNDGTPEYTPVALSFTGGTYTSAYAGVNLKNQAYSGVSSGNYLNRYWNVTTSGITGTFTCAETFNYMPADVVGTEASLNCVRITPPLNFGAANTTLHQLTATASNIEPFGTYTGKDPFSADITFNLKVLLSGLMSPRDGNLPPTGTMYEAIDGELGTPKFGPGIADEITVQLYTSSFTLATEFTGVQLHTDGTASITVPSTFAGDYFVKIVTRTHIAVWSAALVTISGSTVSYDFSDNWNKAYQFAGNDLEPEKQISTGVYALYLGDQDHNTYIDIDDMSALLPDVTNGSVGYLESDIDGYGWVDIDDMALLLENVTIGQYEQSPAMGK